MAQRVRTPRSHVERLYRWKQTKNISLASWQVLKNTLACEWSDNLCRNVRFERRGIKFPKFPGRSAFDKIRAEHKELYGFQTDEHGYLAFQSLQTDLASTLWDSVESKHFTVHETGDSTMCKLLDSKERVPIWCLFIDAANIHKGMKQTGIAFSVPNGCEDSCSYAACKEFALYEASDSWADLNTYAKPVLEMINNLLEKKSVCLRCPKKPDETRTCEVKHAACADQALVHAILGLGGCASSYPCAYCEVPKSKLHDPEEMKKKKPRKRNLRRLGLLSHTLVGKCPACKMTITKDNIAKPGDKPPKIPRKIRDLLPEHLRDRPWAEIHRGVVYGHRTLLNIEPEDWCPCCLHLHLCIVRALHVLTILREVDLRDTDASETMAAQLTKLYETHNVKIKNMKKPSKSKRVLYASLENKTLNGGECTRLMHLIPEALKIVYPSSMRDPHSSSYNKATADKYNRYSELWKLYTEIYEFIITPHPDGLRIKAEQLQEKADVFGDMWKESFKDSTHLYPHILRYHLPDYIRNHDVDPALVMTQGLEFGHKVRKVAHNRTTNFVKPGSGKSRGPSRTQEVFVANLTTKGIDYRVDKTTKEETFKREKKSVYKRKASEAHEKRLDKIKKQKDQKIINLCVIQCIT